MAWFEYQSESIEINQVVDNVDYLVITSGYTGVYEWRPGTIGGKVPCGAVSAGTYDGKDMYIARVQSTYGVRATSFTEGSTCLQDAHIEGCIAAFHLLVYTESKCILNKEQRTIANSY